ncbi:kinase-like domain-containing protein [Rhizophagus irregularis DAOM 181602=DAOM 197198]|nr:kinase-like domain-containing protein [Rhizophagus irregularis DAOM 181602=DAOM 197198]
MLRCIAAGLSDIHSSGLIHRDFHSPEVLRGKEYTQSSDIYSFGIVAYEVCTGFPPYYNISHDELLAIKICQGLRPKFNYKIPQLVYDIINQCWDADLSKRPKAIELEKLFTYLWNDIISKNENNSVIYEQIKEAEEINKKSPSTVQSPLSSTGTLAYTTHPQAVYISRLLIYKNPPKPKNADNNDDSSGIQYSGKHIICYHNLELFYNVNNQYL